MEEKKQPGGRRVTSRLDHKLATRLLRRAKQEDMTINKAVEKYVEIGLSVTYPNQVIDAIPRSGQE